MHRPRIWRHVSAKASARAAGSPPPARDAAASARPSRWSDRPRPAESPAARRRRSSPYADAQTRRDARPRSAMFPRPRAGRRRCPHRRDGQPTGVERAPVGDVQRGGHASGQQRVQVGRREPDADERVEHLRRASAPEHAGLPRQQQRRRLVVRYEDEHGPAERRKPFEPQVTARRAACQDPTANGAPADPSRQRHLGRPRLGSARSGWSPRGTAARRGVRPGVPDGSVMLTRGAHPAASSTPTSGALSKPPCARPPRRRGRERARHRCLALTACPAAHPRPSGR